MIITTHLFYYIINYEEIKSVFTYYFFGFYVYIWFQKVEEFYSFKRYFSLLQT